ncbi:MAG TPA: ParB N-terminal domain-containing protein [Candidatus Paceibacterota bacterium]
MLINIEDVKVSDRIRKDYGNIDELAQDIKSNGLINPPVVTPDYQLIAGERRLRALKSLDYKQIEVRVMTVKDALHQLKLEISENENRKDFSFNEKMAWAKMLEEEYRKIAKDNSLKGITSGSNDPVVGRVRDKVAESVGFSSGTTYDRAKYISDNANEETIKKLDAGDLSINKAYQDLKQQKQSLEQQLETERNKLPKTIDKTDYTTINQLKSEINSNSSKVKTLETEAESYRKKYINTLDQLQIEQGKVSQFMGESTHFELVSSTSELTLKMINFIRDMSKYDYLAEVFNEIPDATRKEYVRSIYGIYKWARNILNQVKHDDVIGVNQNNIEIINYTEENIND